MNMNGVPLNGGSTVKHCKKKIKRKKKNITHCLPHAISQKRASLEHPDNETAFSPHFIVDIGHYD